MGVTMKRALVLGGAVLALATMVMADFADARRLGGGRSLGAQRQSVAPPSAPPTAGAPSGAASQPVMPATPGATLAAKPAAAAAPAAAGASRWLGPIAGLAAGLGLAALLSHFGLSDEFASLLLVALLAGGAFFVVRMLLARRATAQRPLQYAGGTGTAGARDPAKPLSPALGGPRIEPVLGASAAAPAALAGKRLPHGFDAAAFVRNAKQQFIALQAANDAADRKAIADVTTPKMYAELAAELEGRGPQPATEVVSLDAEVLEVVTEGREHWASVRYTGTLREDGELLPNAFDEVWHLTKPVDGSSGWLLAGIQQHA